MKKYIVIMGLALAGVFASCSDLTDSLEAESASTLDESVIFSIPDLAKRAVDGIKIPMGETNSYRGRYLPWYGMNTDCERYNSSESTSSDKADLVTYDAKPNNSEMNTENNVWAMMYSGIERANVCIRGLRTYGNPQPDNEMGYLLGEALTLRAIYYADLLKTWGDVPARFEPVNNETIYIAKTNRDIIYKQLIADLAEAATLVPWPGGNAATTSVERINKAFVKGLRARLALAASGFQQYPDGIRRSTDPELSVQTMYALALQECRDVISSGSAHLEPTFEALWRKYNQEETAAGGESLWEIPFGAGRGRMIYTFGVNHQTNDQFQQMGSNRGGLAGPLPHLYYDYDMDDTRRDVTCVPYRWASAVNGIAKQQLGAINRWYFGKFRFEWMSRVVTSTNDDGVNKIYMRYAEVLLMAAEAANEIEGPGAAAEYLKEIRRRAFPAAQHGVKVDAYVNSLTDKISMHNAIMEEHKFEFTGEMERKQALIRWNKLGENLQRAKEKMYRLQQRTGEYADVATTVYSKLNPDNITISVYGFNHGETNNPGAGWTSTSWSNLSDAKIEGLYRGNPDQRQFWPIWQVYLDRSNGMLINDYNY